jgi:A/G-specific adenine glycosylase
MKLEIVSRIGRSSSLTRSRLSSIFRPEADPLRKGSRALIEQKTGFRRAIMAWYRRERRELSWRGVLDPYVVWLTEIMLQQTRVEQGTPYIERFLALFPSVEALAAADIDRVLKAWEGLGYYSRARNLHKAAKVIVGERNGQFPDTAPEWRTLPGVGRYTAGAVASIAFGRNEPVVDGNVKRVLARLTNLRASIDDAKVAEELWVLAGVLVQGKAPGDFNQALMELGAQICLPRNARCGGCPTRKYCAASALGVQETLPKRRPKKTVLHHKVVIAAIKKNGRYLLGKRPADGMLGGLWEFPGGKVKPGEADAVALRRKVKEELGIAVEVGDFVATVNHAYSHFKVTLRIYRCAHVQGKAVPNAHSELKWVLPRDFERYAFPTANHKFLKLLV